MDEALARQMRRQRPPRRLLAREAADRHLRDRRSQLGRRHGLAGILFQGGQLQFKLLEQRAPLRRLPVTLVPQLGDEELELLDLQRPRARLRFRAHARRTLGKQHRLQRLDVVGQRISHVRHAASESQDRAPDARNRRPESLCRTQPAAAGTHVRCGARQSIPSSR
jgi:hypothetical protein